MGINREYLDNFQNKLLGSSSKWVPKYLYSVPGQTEGRSKTFLEWKSIDLSHELSLTCGGNVNYYKSVHQPIPTRENWEHPGNFQNKSVRSALNWVSRYILFLAKLKGARREATFARLPSRALGCHKRWKSISFCKIWNNSTPPLFFIRTPYK